MFLFGFIFCVKQTPLNNRFSWRARTVFFCLSPLDRFVCVALIEKPPQEQAVPPPQTLDHRVFQLPINERADSIVGSSGNIIPERHAIANIDTYQYKQHKHSVTQTSETGQNPNKNPIWQPCPHEKNAVFSQTLL